MDKVPDFGDSGTGRCHGNQRNGDDVLDIPPSRVACIFRQPCNHTTQYRSSFAGCTVPCALGNADAVSHMLGVFKSPYVAELIPFWLLWFVCLLQLCTCNLGACGSPNWPITEMLVNLRVAPSTVAIALFQGATN